MHYYVLLNVGEDCIMQFMAWGVWSSARDKTECCIAPREHNPSAINHMKHELTNIKWFIVALWSTSSCPLTFNGVCWCIQHVQIMRFMGRAGQGSAFDVAHGATIKYCIVVPSGD